MSKINCNTWDPNCSILLWFHSKTKLTQTARTQGLSMSVSSVTPVYHPFPRALHRIHHFSFFAFPQPSHPLASPQKSLGKNLAGRNLPHDTPFYQWEAQDGGKGCRIFKQ